MSWRCPGPGPAPASQARRSGGLLRLCHPSGQGPSGRWQGRAGRAGRALDKGGLQERTSAGSRQGHEGSRGESSGGGRPQSCAQGKGKITSGVAQWEGPLLGQRAAGGDDVDRHALHRLSGDATPSPKPRSRPHGRGAIRHAARGAHSTGPHTAPRMGQGGVAGAASVCLRRSRHCAAFLAPAPRPE